MRKGGGGEGRGPSEMKHLFCACIASVALSVSGLAQTEITLIAPGGIRAAIEQLLPGFEQKTGYKVKATFGSGLGTKQQVAKGEPFDVPIVQPPYPEVLASGHVIESSATKLASVSIGVAVRQGMPKPDISVPEAARHVFLSARYIAYPDPAGGAAAGVTFEQTLKTLGIWDLVQARLRRARGGAEAMRMVARGETEIGVTFVSEMNEPGADMVGPLPKQIAPSTTLVGFVSSHAHNPAASRALLQYLSAPEAAVAYKSQHMEPAQ